EIRSIWRVMESRRWWMSATSRLGEDGGGVELRKFGGVESPTVELSQSLSVMPARRAAASALSRTDGSMPSTLHRREFMIPSGSDFGAPPGACNLPARPRTENRMPRGSSASAADFFLLR